MRRRDFIFGLGGAAASSVSWPLAARGQQRALPVVGFLGSTSPVQYAAFVAGFHRGLSEAGFVEGRNVAIEYRWAEGRYDRLPALAADLVSRQVTVIATPGSTPATLAAKAATTTIPIVFYVGGDPVELGLVASLNRPGGNLTGVTTLASEVGPKRLELLHELLPTATIVAALVNPTSPDLGERFLRDLLAAAPRFGLQLHILQATTERELEFFSARLEQLASLASRHALPTVFQFREFAAAGGLMSYGAGFAEACRQAARRAETVSRPRQDNCRALWPIMRGAPPSTIPGDAHRTSPQPPISQSDLVLWHDSEVAENPDDFRFQGIPDVAEKARHVAF
jgi:putative tryptophan/tyrosine transport system substrate-binding protein